MHPRQKRLREGHPPTYVRDVEERSAVRIVGVSEDDIDWITRACQDPEIQRWTTVPRPYTRDHAVWFVNNPREEAHRWAIRTTTGNEPVGMISVHSVNSETRAADIGYWVAPWGRRVGAASGAVRLVIDEVRRLGSVDTVEARVAVTNTASRRTVESCGFVAVEDPDGVRCPDGGGEVEAVVYRLAL